MRGCRLLTTYRLSEVISPAFTDSHHAVKDGSINELVEKGGRGGAKSSYLSVEIAITAFVAGASKRGPAVWNIA